MIVSATYIPFPAFHMSYHAFQIPTGHECYRWPFESGSSSPPVLREKILSEGYTTSVPPPPTSAEGGFVDVEVRVVLEELLALNEVDKQVSMTATVDVTWLDSRLAMGEACKKDLNISDCEDVSFQIFKESTESLKCCLLTVSVIGLLQLPDQTYPFSRRYIPYI